MEIFPAKTTLTEAAADVEPEELNLELSLGPIGAPEPAKPTGGWPAEAVVAADDRKGISFVDLTGFYGKGRSEMEARMVEARTMDRFARQEEAFSGERMRLGVAGAVKMPYMVHPAQPFPAMFPYHHQVQYVPVPAGDYGYGFPYVMPSWVPTNAAAVAAGAESFPVPMPVGSRGATAMKAYGKAVASNVGYSLPVDSQGSSASGVSDHRSNRIHGGGFSFSSSSSGHSSLHRSSDAQPKPPHSTLVITAKDGANKSTGPALVNLQHVLSAAGGAAAFPAVPENLQVPVAAEKKMAVVSPPRVSATGDGPNGKTVAGFLYKYTRSEVMIVCVCHGAFFTPADFVLHAGGTDVSQPLKQIIMVGA